MRFPFDRKVLFAFLLPFAALACGGGDTGGSGGSGTTTSTGGSGGTGGTTASGGTGTGGSGAAPSCPPGPGYGGNEKALAVGVVTVKLVDQAGNPAVGVPVFVCGTDICTAPAKSGADGGASIPANQTLKAPAFKYGDGLEWTKFAQPVPAGDTAVGTVAALKLPALGTGDMFAVGASVKSNGVTIDVPAGGSVTVDTLTYEDPTTQTFRVALLPAGAVVPAIDPTLGLEIVYGAAPMETEFCPPATLHVPNTAGWTAGAAVELFIHGLDVGQELAPYGGWAKVSDAAVSADGKEIVTADGQGIPLLSTFGLRLKK
jgi:hypothetical protein